MNHTKGEWTDSLTNSNHAIVVVTEFGKVKHHIYNALLSDETKANAKLIKEAPNMLDELMHLLEYCSGLKEYQKDRIKTVIEKATQ